MMRKHNTVKVVLVTILVLMLLTWILPAAYYSSGYVDQGRVQMGLFDLFAYPTTVLQYFGYISIFIVVVGGFYGVLNKTGAYRTLLDSMVKSFKGKDKFVISIIMILIAVITSICGLQLGLMIFYPFIIALILMMGYDKIVAALTIVGSAMIGIAGSTYAYANTSILVSTLSVDIQSKLLFKGLILVLGLVLLIFFTMKYISKNPIKKVDAKKEEKKAVKVSKTAKKETKTTKGKSTKTTKSTTKAAKVEEEKVVVKEEKKESVLDAFVPEEVSGKHSVLPLVVIFAIIFIIMILAFISWSGAFGLTAFDDATTSVTGFKVFGFTLFGKLLGTVNAFGSWTLSDLSTVTIIASLILMLIYKIKFSDGLQAFVNGAKRFLEPAVVVALVYVCLVITTYHPFQLVIYKAVLGLTKGFNVFTTGIVAILAPIFNVEPAYAFQSALPYLTSEITKSYSIIAIMFQSLYGVVMLVAPTSAVLMMILSYLEIPYKEWLKNIWKLLLSLIVVLFIIFTILVLI